jgi:calcineurin-like phosphoesterase family protein
MWFFTADEHYGHANIIKHCNRPFNSLGEMDDTITNNFNSVVKKNDVTVHAGDFAWRTPQDYIKKLNGSHIFIKGSHDSWLPASAKYMWRKMFDGKLIVVCHYAMRTWERAHHKSWQLYGHSHGRLEPVGLQYDVGVDNNNFYPVSLDEIKFILERKDE